MDLFVINLDRSTGRLESFAATNAHLKNITRFPAVEGASIDRAELVRKNILEEPSFYSDGAIGNALSHLNLWQMAAQRPAFTTAVEDDAVIHADFENLAPALIATLPEEWDIVLWGWNFDSVLSFDLFEGTPCLAQFSQEKLRAHCDAIRRQPAQPALYRLNYAFGSVGYSVSAAGAAKLAARALPIKPCMSRIPVLGREVPNEAMDCVMAGLYGELKAYVCFPPLIVTRNDHAGSTVQKNKCAGAERSLGLAPQAGYTCSRKYKRKYARYLFKRGDWHGGLRWYLKYLCTGKARGL